MRTMYWLLPLLLLGFTQAASVPAVSLFKTLGSSVEIPPSLGGDGMEYETFYPIKGASALQLNVWLHYDARTTNRVAGYWLTAYSKGFSALEQQKVKAVVTSISSQCLNISPQRLDAINEWLDAQNKSTRVNKAANFGPLGLHFKRYYDSGPSKVVTEIEMSRSGKAGVAPWINYCTDSGTL